MKKILFIFHDTNMTGASISLYRIIQNIVIQNNYEVHILLTHTQGPLYNLLSQYKVKIHILNKKNNGNLFSKLWTRAVYFPRFLFTLAYISPSLVYANTLMNIGEVIIASLMHKYTLVHAHEGEKFIQKHAILIKLADYFTCEYIVVSNYALKSLQKFTQQKKKKHIVYNGIEILEKKKPLIPNKVSIKISVIGTIDRNKSQLTAIQALNFILQSTSLKLHLNFFGKLADHIYYQELMDYIDSKNLSNHVSFHGEIVDQNVMYGQTDILLITSKDETFSLTALEAFNRSIPVIASNVGGLPEVVEDDETGLLFNAEDFQELAKQTIRIANNHSLRNKLIDQAYQKARQKFDIDQTVSKVSTIINRALNGSS